MTVFYCFFSAVSDIQLATVNFYYYLQYFTRMLLLQLRDLKLADQYELPLAPYFYQNCVKHLYTAEAENLDD